MTLIQIPTEQTTAATDLLLCILALIGLAYIWRNGPAGLRGALWRGVLVLLATASLLGAIAHGVVVSEATHAAIWRATYLVLALLVGAFLLAAIRDVAGDRAARRAAIAVTLIALAFAGYFIANPDSFAPFILYEAGAMLLSLTGYLWLGWRGTLAGSGWIAASIATNLVAAAAQSTGSVNITIFWPFDHNGVFHLIQMLGIALLIHGLRRGATN